MDRTTPMEDYLLLLRVGPAASIGMLWSEEATVQEQPTAVESIGGQVVGCWAALGRYDMAMHVRFPSGDQALAWSLLSNASGMFSEALRLFSVEDLPRIAGFVSVIASTSSGDSEEKHKKPRA